MRYRESPVGICYQHMIKGSQSGYPYVVANNISCIPDLFSTSNPKEFEKEVMWTRLQNIVPLHMYVSRIDTIGLEMEVKDSKGDVSTLYFQKNNLKKAGSIDPRQITRLTVTREDGIKRTFRPIPKSEMPTGVRRLVQNPFLLD